MTGSDLTNTHGQARGSSQEDAKTYYVSPANKKEKNLYHHPIIKPVEFIDRRQDTQTSQVGEECRFLRSISYILVSLLTVTKIYDILYLVKRGEIYANDHNSKNTAYCSG